jgi:uncharacterized protein
MNSTTQEMSAPVKPSDVHIRWGTRIPLRNGLHLSAIAYLPNNAAATPAILAMTPYVAQSHHEHAMYFAAQGFAFLSVDVRGRGNSDGEFHLLNEAQDSVDVIEWVARQPYCNGRVAMWGASYLGYCQWAAARERPPSLATIVPVAAPFRGVDSPVRNNIFTPYSIQWLTIVSGRTSQEKMFLDQSFWSGKFARAFESAVPFRELDRYLGNPSALFQEWACHAERDDYWDSHNPTREQYAALSLPILTITGAYDADQPGALAHYREHVASASAAARARHYLVIGPWDHSGTSRPKLQFGGIEVGAASCIDLRRLHLEWYRWTLQGGDRPGFLRKNVAYYVTGAETWRYADTLESITAGELCLQLDASSDAQEGLRGGALAGRIARHREPDEYVYDPRDVSDAALESTLDPESLVDESMLHARVGKQLVYHSAPFDRDTDVCGFFKLAVWLSIDQPDTDFQVSIQEVAPEGSSLLLSIDRLRARYRESPRQARLIQTRAPLRYDFSNFTFVARRMRCGSRLRLVLGPINSIFWQKNYNSGGAVCDETQEDGRPVRVRLFHDDAHPSALLVPLGAGDTDE